MPPGACWLYPYSSFSLYGKLFTSQTSAPAFKLATWPAILAMVAASDLSTLSSVPYGTTLPNNQLARKHPLSTGPALTTPCASRTTAMRVAVSMLLLVC